MLSNSQTSYDVKFNPLSANITKWSNTLKQFFGKCVCVFGHFVGLALKELSSHKHKSFELKVFIPILLLAKKSKKTTTSIKMKQMMNLKCSKMFCACPLLSFKGKLMQI